jgi:hypothetical protein
MRKISSARITNAKKNLVGVASVDRTERTTALVRAKNQKSIYVDNRLNHCAIGTLDSVMFAMLHLKTVIHRNRLAYYIVGLLE